MKKIIATLFEKSKKEIILPIAKTIAVLIYGSKMMEEYLPTIVKLVNFNLFIEILNHLPIILSRIK